MNKLILLIVVSLIAVSSASYSFLNIYQDKTLEDLIFGEYISIHPIVENEDSNRKDRYIRTLKLSYKDQLDTPIKVNKSNKIQNRCSWQSSLTFYSELDSLKLVSVKRMSCDIKAFFNLEESDISWLESNSIYKIRIVNLTTSYSQKLINEDIDYFKDIFKVYNYKY